MYVPDVYKRQPTNFGMARRTSTGVDFNRVALLLAVLEKRIGLQIQNQDVYINVVEMCIRDRCNST